MSLGPAQFAVIVSSPSKRVAALRELDHDTAAVAAVVSTTPKKALDGHAGFITIIATTPKSIYNCSPIVVSTKRKVEYYALDGVTRNLFGSAGAGASSAPTGADSTEYGSSDHHYHNIEYEISHDMSDLYYLYDYLADAGLFDIAIHEPSDEEEALVAQNAKNASSSWRVSEVLGHVLYYITVPIKKAAAEIASLYVLPATQQQDEDSSLSLLEDYASQIEQLDAYMRSLNASVVSQFEYGERVREYIEHAVQQIRTEMNESTSELHEYLTEAISSNKILEDIILNLKSYNGYLYHEVALLHGLRDEDRQRHAELSYTIEYLKYEIEEKSKKQQLVQPVVGDVLLRAKLQTYVRSLADEIKILTTKMYSLYEEKSLLESKNQIMSTLSDEERRRQEQDTKIKQLEQDLALVKQYLASSAPAQQQQPTVSMPPHPAMLSNPLFIPPIPRFLVPAKKYNFAYATGGMPRSLSPARYYQSS